LERFNVPATLATPATPATHLPINTLFIGLCLLSLHATGLRSLPATPATRVADVDDDFDVLADRAVVGRIFKVHAAPVGTPWMWTLAFGQREDRTPTHGYEATRKAAMAAFAKSWWRK
jgi:hypothetical protein